jgi:ketosteroid isomerase-like protein
VAIDQPSTALVTAAEAPPAGLAFGRAPLWVLRDAGATKVVLRQVNDADRYVTYVQMKLRAPMRQECAARRAETPSFDRLPDAGDLSYRKQRFKPHGEREMPRRRYDAYRAAEPYFDLVRGALGDLVEGEHFFDIVAEDIGYEVLYDIAGWPRVIRGSADLMTQFRGYCDNIELQSADNLIVHKAEDDRVVIIEYEVHGTILATGVKYNNRFCSIIKIENRKIAHWRDYMDSLAAWNALARAR